MNKKLLFVLPAVMLLAAACNNRAAVQTPANDNGTAAVNQSSDVSTNVPPSNQGQIVTMVKVALDPQNNSGQSGMVTITEVQGKAKVILNLTGAPSKTLEPAHIHTGS